MGWASSAFVKQKVPDTTSVWCGSDREGWQTSGGLSPTFLLRIHNAKVIGSVYILCTGRGICPLSSARGFERCRKANGPELRAPNFCRAMVCRRVP